MKSRTEQEMFDLILSTARSDERIRAVVLNGSRADPDAKADCFQDYDIVFVVKDVRSFVSDPLWIDRFGELMILQLPTDWYAHPYDYDKGEPFTYLMQFMDGTRIDLTLDTGYIDNGEPAVALLDKDDRLSNLPAPSSSAYCVKAPGRKEYCDCCNEFWWLGPYIAKGLWRKELPYVKNAMECYRRPEFMKMLGWKIGILNDFHVGIGKHGKHIAQYLSHAEYREFEKTYPGSEPQSIWDALFSMNELFRKAAGAVSAHFGFPYPRQDDERVTAFLHHVRRLPENAETLY